MIPLANGKESFYLLPQWTKYYANSDEATFVYSERCAPSILITFINMMLLRDNTANPGCDPYFYSGGHNHL
jgi:hypothetical protein